jgi:hypothetical protein
MPKRCSGEGGKPEFKAREFAVKSEKISCNFLGSRNSHPHGFDRLYAVPGRNNSISMSTYILY